MNIEDVKQIPIADYLHSLGYSPVKRQGNGLWYKSPLREEHEASFKVNTDRNLWYDFGAGKGGNIKRIAGALDPRGYEVHPIASPEPHEKARHYLWRFWTRLRKQDISLFLTAHGTEE